MIGLRLAFTLYNLGSMPRPQRRRGRRARAEHLGDTGLLAQALAVSAIVDFSLGRGDCEPRLRRALSCRIPAYARAPSSTRG